MDRPTSIHTDKGGGIQLNRYANKGINWLVSYPKSGNTWFRIFLANLRFPKLSPVNINQLPELNTAIAFRSLFDRMTGLPSSSLRPEEIDILRPAVCDALASEWATDKQLYLKVHEAWVLNSQSEPIFSPQSSRAAIYIVRNPLDLTVSWSHHFGEGIDQVIKRLSDSNNALVSDEVGIARQLPQLLLSWSAHVLSWLDQSDVPVLLLRYEDMLSKPLDVFSEAARFLGLYTNRTAIENAIEHSAFNTLSRMEDELGFRERSRHAGKFFRSGTSGAWSDVLTETQVATLVKDHGKIMKRLGYINELGGLEC